LGRKLGDAELGGRGETFGDNGVGSIRELSKTDTGGRPRRQRGGGSGERGGGSLHQRSIRKTWRKEKKVTLTEEGVGEGVILFHQTENISKGQDVTRGGRKHISRAAREKEGH